MTFRDYIVECMLYDYSNEHFELCKENAEVELSKQFIRNQIIMNESAEELGIDTGKDGITLTESFFTESVSETELQAFIEEAEEKKQNIFKRAWEWIKKQIARFGGWLQKITGQLPDVEAMETRISELIDSLVNERMDKDKLSAKNDELMNEIGRLRKAYSDVDRQMQKLGAEVGTLNEKNAKADATIKSLNQKIENKDSEIARQKKGRENAMNIIKDKNKEINNKNQKIKDLQASNAAKDATIKDQSNTISNDQNTIDQLRNELDKASDKLRNFTFMFRRSSGVLPVAELADYVAKYVDALAAGSDKGVNSVRVALKNALNSSNLVKVEITDKEIAAANKKIKEISNKFNQAEIPAGMNDNSNVVECQSMFAKVIGNTMNATSGAVSGYKTLFSTLNSIIIDINRKIA